MAVNVFVTKAFGIYTLFYLSTVFRLNTRHVFVSIIKHLGIRLIAIESYISIQVRALPIVDINCSAVEMTTANP
jgi:hypothetical protein